MKIKDVILDLQKNQTWVNWNHTRDHILAGDENQEVTGIGVCWVATKQMIKAAHKAGLNFVITHENPFYDCSTNPQTAVWEAVLEKQALIKKYNNVLYRCHDGWDMFPEYGVADQWAKRLGYAFEPRLINSYNQYAQIPEQSVAEIAQHVAAVLSQDGENGAYVFGDPTKRVRRLAIGTGAATNIFSMLDYRPDAVIVSDDGITNWYAAQFAIDHDLPLIVVNHAGCEICGMKAMEAYLKQQLPPNIKVMYIAEGFDIHYYTSEA